MYLFIPNSAYIYIEREREKEREKEIDTYIDNVVRYIYSIQYCS